MQAARSSLAPLDAAWRARKVFGHTKSCRLAASMAAENGANGAMPEAKHDDQVDALRAEMAKANVDAYIVPTEDPHMVGRLRTPQ
jgi:hypothetical protein